MTETDVADQVAGIEIGITFAEHIFHNDRLILFRIGIAIKWRTTGNFTNQQTCCAFFDAFTVTFGITYRLVFVFIEFNNRVGSWGEADSIVKIEHIAETDIAFTGCI